jgi:hypothetical protein
MMNDRDTPDPFGPWGHELSEMDRRLHWRGMAALALTLLGPNAPFTKCASRAEYNQDHAAEAWRELLVLPPLPRRRILSTWSALSAMASG